MQETYDIIYIVGDDDYAMLNAAAYDGVVVEDSDYDGSEDNDGANKS